MVLGWFWVDLEAGIGISMKKAYQYKGSNPFFYYFQKNRILFKPFFKPVLKHQIFFEIHQKNDLNPCIAMFFSC